MKPNKPYDKRAQQCAKPSKPSVINQIMPSHNPGMVTGEDARRIISESINPPAPTPELIELMRRR